MRIRALVLFVFGLILSGCVGTGKTGMSDASSAVSGTTGKVVVIRKGAFTGAGAAITIFLNGKKVGTLGNGQFLSVNASPGSNKIEAKITGIQGVGMNTPSDTFSRPSSGNAYYTVGVESLIVTAQLELKKTDKAGFLAAMRKYEEQKKRNLQ